MVENILVKMDHKLRSISTIFQIYASQNGKIGLWKLKGMSEESITPPSTTDKTFDPEIVYNYGKGKMKFKEICLKQNSVSFIHESVVNLYISYELDTCLRDLNADFTLSNCLFGVVKLSTNVGPDKYGHSGYDIGFDVLSQFPWVDESWA